VLRVRTVDAVVLQLPRGQDLPTLAAAWIGAPIPAVAAALGLVLGLGLMAWVVRQPEGRTADVWLGGVGSGAVVVAMWWVSGRLGYLPEHPETLQEVFLATNSRRMEALSMVAPVGYALDWLLYFSDASKALTTGIVSVVGVLFGSALVALGTGTFRWEGFTNVEDMGNHLVGAVLMGVGGVTAMGCTLGQGLSGISTLSMGSVLALAGIVAGGVAALRYQSWRLDRMV
jgi:hypothetical protein